MHGRKVTGALEKLAGNKERKASCAGQLVRSRRKKVEQALHELTKQEKKRANSRWFLGPPSSGFGGLQNGLEMGLIWA